MKAKVSLALCLAILLGLGLAGSVLALVSDLDISGVVDNGDLSILYAAYGSSAYTNPSINWDWRADINRDAKVDLKDITLAAQEFGEDFNFHYSRRIENSAPYLAPIEPLCTIFDMDAVMDSRSHIHLVVQEDSGDSSRLYYTQLDKAGNTMVHGLYLDNHISDPRLALDSEDNAHVVWYGDSTSGIYGIYYARINPEGEILEGPALICPYDGLWCDGPVSVAVDSFQHAHFLAGGNDNYRVVHYGILDAFGVPLLTPANLNTQRVMDPTQVVEGLYPVIAVDRFDTRHITWYEEVPGPVVGQLVYTRIPYGELPDINQLPVAQILGSYNPRRQFIVADSLGAAHLVYGDFRNGVEQVLWRRINPDGSLSEEKLVTDQALSEAPLVVHLTIDAQDQLHIAARSKSRSGANLGYARLDRDGNILTPFRTAVYEFTGGDLSLVVSPSGEDAAILYNMYNPCQLRMVSTSPDPASNDFSRADVLVDSPSVHASKMVARINEQVTVQATVHNHGYVAAQNVQVVFTDTLAGTNIPAAILPSLPPFSGATVIRTFTIPWMEDATLLPLRIAANSSTSETTLENNAYTLTLGIVPPATSFDLSVAVYDETRAPDNRDLAVYLYGSQLKLEDQQTNYLKEISFTQAINGFIGVPLDKKLPPNYNTTLQLSLSKEGFSSTTQMITATRRSDDPYRVDVVPSTLVKLYVNQWGEIHGTVISGTYALSNATVYLDGIRNTLTDGSGAFSFSKVISGSHQLEAWHAGNAPTQVNLILKTGEGATPQINMPPTQRGYVRGQVINDLGRPFSGIKVDLYGDSTKIASATTDDQGDYQLEVANVSAYANYHVYATCGLCDSYTSANFTLIAGLIHREDFPLSWTVTNASLQASGDVTSWEQEERYNKLDDDGLPIGLWVQTKIAKLKNYFLSYEVNTYWGKYHYHLGLNYSEAGGIKQVESLGLDLVNGEMYSYDVQVNSYTGDVSNIDLCALRIDRVDLVEVDGAGNPEKVLAVLDDSQWYVASPDGTPRWQTYDNIQTSAPNWSKTAVRVFLRVGKYDALDDNHWQVWHPPVAVASLTGSGSGAGADYQILLWRLSGNKVEVLKGLGYYQAAVGTQATTLETLYLTQSPANYASAAASASLQNTSADAPRLGMPFPIDLELSGATLSPFYSIDFGLRFDPLVLRLISVQAGEDFTGAKGAFTGLPPIEQINANGLLNYTVVAPLGAYGGIEQGTLARIYFLPLQVASNTEIELVYLLYDDLANDNPLSIPEGSLQGTSTAIQEALTFLPLVWR